MNSDATVYDVVIVGLGPTGLTLAHGLGQVEAKKGADHLVLRRARRARSSGRTAPSRGGSIRVFQGTPGN